MTFDGWTEPCTRPFSWTNPRTWATMRPRACTCWKPRRRPLAIASAKLRPATSSVTRQRSPFHSMNAITLTRLGCETWKAAFRSAASAGSRPAGARSAFGNMRMATLRPSVVSSPRHTTPSGPRAISSFGTKRRARAAGAAGAGAAAGAAAGGAGEAGGGRGVRGRRRQARHPLVDVAELQVLGLHLLEEREGLRRRPRRLVGEGHPVVEVEVRGGDRLAADRLPHPLHRQRRPPGLDEEPREELRRGAVVLVSRDDPLQEGDRLLALAGPREASPLLNDWPARP